MCKQSSIHAAGDSTDCEAKEISHAGELHCIGDGLPGKAGSHITKPSSSSSSTSTSSHGRND